MTGGVSTPSGMIGFVSSENYNCGMDRAHRFAKTEQSISVLPLTCCRETKRRNLVNGILYDAYCFWGSARRLSWGGELP